MMSVKRKRSSGQLEDEGVVLQPNIMKGPEDRLCRPDNMEVEIWTEVLRLNSYLGKEDSLQNR